MSQICCKRPYSYIFLLRLSFYKTTTILLKTKPPSRSRSQGLEVYNSVALAEHYIYTRVFEPFVGQMVHIVIIDNFHNILMKESKTFAAAIHFTTKNVRGSFRSKTPESSDTATENPYVNYDQLSRHVQGLDIDTNAPYIHTMQNVDREYAIPSNMDQFYLLKKCMALDPRAPMLWQKRPTDEDTAAQN
ncbi:hypothetical protein BGX30_007488 [Mortierella sp. GBA39]|nr:hypothetical protein BGX30_007488 [Mortierella sp. GBA39]